MGQNFLDLTLEAMLRWRYLQALWKHSKSNMDKVGRLMYPCDVGMLMDDREWHNGVSWEVAEGYIQLHKLATFHWPWCEKSAVGSVPIIPDWSRPSAAARMEAGVPRLDSTWLYMLLCLYSPSQITS